MKQALILIVVLPLLGACGHSELKAPCGPTASASASPCDIKPLNLAKAPVQAWHQ